MDIFYLLKHHAIRSSWAIACCAFALSSGFDAPPSPEPDGAARLFSFQSDEISRIAAIDDDPDDTKPSDDAKPRDDKKPSDDAKQRDDTKPSDSEKHSQEAAELETRIEDLIKRHNDARRGEGLRPLVQEKKLSKAAAIHAQDMADEETMSHKGSDGSSPADRVQKCGYDFLRIGENVAFGQDTPKEVVAEWLESPPHRKNILGNYTEIGASVKKSKRGKLYWCVEFGVPKRRKK